MSVYFFPGCKVKAQFKDSSEKARKYIAEKCGAITAGCCRTDRVKLTENDKAIVVCNNCAAIMEESSDTDNIDFIWQIIDNDENFVFPDYKGEKMTIQDCWVAVEKREVQDCVRSLMKKMNIEIMELSDNYDKTTFCGVNLLSPCTESNAALAHKRYVKNGSHMFRPSTPQQQLEIFQDHCKGIVTDKVVTYCKFCTDAINAGGKNAIHLLDLLFLN